MYVENLIVDVSNKLMIYHENLKRLRKYLEITRQVQRTPQVYVAAVSEVVRRRTFSQAFLTVRQVPQSGGDSLCSKGFMFICICSGRAI